jgi:hypothetical protein
MVKDLRYFTRQRKYIQSRLETKGARQISSAPSPGGEGWDEGEQLFAPQRHI